MTKISPTRLSVQLLNEQENFSLVLGGPLFQLLRRAKLTDDTEGLLWRRIITISLLAWLPLCLITLFTGQWVDDAKIPFLYDLEVHVRFLLAIPIMIAAELLVHIRMRKVVQQFLQRRLIPDAALQQFEVALHSAFELRNSIKAELILVALVYTAGLLLWRNVMVLETNTWYAMQTSGGLSLTLAGYWYAGISLPIFQFLVVRWYYRIGIWVRFLWKVSRIKLQLLPTHTDRLGGLSFLSGTFYAFTPLATAHGTMLAAMLANRIFYQGAVVTDFKLEIVLMVIFIQILILVPLLFFSQQLAQAKRDAKREYGLLVMQHNREFDEKWFRSGKPKESPLGNPDMSSLVDLGASFDVVQSMNIVPIKKDAVLFLAIATVAPLIPLALTMMPMEELLRKLVGLVF